MKKPLIFLLSCFVLSATIACLVWSFRHFQPQFNNGASSEASFDLPAERPMLASDMQNYVSREEVAKIQEAIQKLSDNSKEIALRFGILADDVRMLKEKQIEPKPELLVLTGDNGVLAAPLDAFSDKSDVLAPSTAYFANAAASSESRESTSFSDLSHTNALQTPQSEDSENLVELASALEPKLEEPKLEAPNWEKIHDAVYGGVLLIRCESYESPNVHEGKRTNYGSGFIVKLFDRYFIVTVEHLIRGFQPHEITIKTVRKNHITNYEYFACFPWIDTVVFEISREEIEKFPEITVFKPGESEKLGLYENIIAIGNPPGFPGHTLMGSVSNKNFFLDSDDELPSCRYLELNASLTAGMSGGPIIDSRGNVVSMVKATLDNFVHRNGYEISFPIGVSYGIRMEDIVSAIANRINNSSWGYTQLGVELKDVLNETYGVSGVAVTRVVPNSPAAAAGLLEGDQIVQFKGKSPTDYHELEYLIAISEPGEAQIELLRRGEPITRTVKLTYLKQ